MSGVRTLFLWCPDWSVVAAEIVDGVAASGAVVVLHGNRVVACSAAARAEGVRRGLRRREAQSRCPQLVVVDHDPGRDARAFEPVVAAVEEVVAGVEVVRAGACAVAVRGPARYFGGEEAAAERIVEQVAQACAVEAQAGIADGVFAAGLAARTGQLVTPGATREFLAGVPIEAVDRGGLADLLRRLGVKTLGDFAALPGSDVLSRFGFEGALAHRLAAGLDHRPLAVRRPPPDLDVTATYDEPLDRVDVAAFAGRALAERLHEQLAAHGLACTRLGIEAVTADGQELHRVWRHDGLLTAAAIAERVRWQLDGWLTGARRGAENRPTAGLVRLRLIPDGVIVHLGLQPGLWGDSGAERERAHRALSRVQGLLGPEAVLTPVIDGGRSAGDQIKLVAWGDERVQGRPASGHADPVPGTAMQVAAEVEREVLAGLALIRGGADSSPGAGDGPAAGVSAVEVVDGSVAGVGGGSVAEHPWQLVRGGSVADVRDGLAAGMRGGPTAGGGVAEFRTADRSVLGLVPDISRSISSMERGEAVEGGKADGEGGLAGSRSDVEAFRQGPAEEQAGGVGQGVVGGGAHGGAAGVGGLKVMDHEEVVDHERKAKGPGREGQAGEQQAGEQRAGEQRAGKEQVGEGRAGKALAGKEGEWVQRVSGGRRRKVAGLPPWPGRIPRPAPALVPEQGLAAVVADFDGELVGVSARLELTGEPVTLVVGRGRPVEIVGWAGPWPAEERWWAPGEARRRARFQVAVADGRAFLLALAGGHWAVEAVYD